MTLNTNDTPAITEPASFRSLDGAYSDHENFSARHSTAVDPGRVDSATTNTAPQRSTPRGSVRRAGGDGKR